MRRQRLSILWTGIMAVVGLTPSLWAVNRMLINNQTVPVSSTGLQVPLLADIDQDTYAFSVHVRYDAAKLRITNVALGSHVSSTSPEYAQGTTNNSTGDLVYGVVFDTSEPSITKFLDGPATARQMLVLTVDVLSASATSATFTFQNDTAPPWRRNVLSDGNGTSVSPLTLVNGTLTIVSLVPVIQSISPNSGAPGQIFNVVGDNFNQAGLTVQVGGITPSSFTLQPDNRTIRVTAPACAATGFAAVRVCTNFGCDSETNGFNFTSGCSMNLPPIIESFLSNSGEAGQNFFVIGQNMDTPGINATVGGRPSPNVLVIDDTTLQVRAPECDAEGCAPIQVCNDFGCDSDPCGFSYDVCEVPGIGPFKRGDCNGDGQVSGVVTDAVVMLNFNFLGAVDPPCFAACDVNADGAFQGTVTDAVYVLNFNFLGGPAPPAPYPNCGTSEDPEDLSLGCVDTPGCP